MQPLPLKLTLTTPEFFATPLKKIVVDDHLPNTGRVYLLKGNRIVAVATRGGKDAALDS